MTSLSASSSQHHKISMTSSSHNSSLHSRIVSNERLD